MIEIPNCDRYFYNSNNQLFRRTRQGLKQVKLKKDYLGNQFFYLINNKGLADYKFNIINNKIVLNKIL